MEKLKELDRLHKKAEVNFRINTLWDGPHTFYFNTRYLPNPGSPFNPNCGIDYKDTRDFDTLEEGIAWLIKKFKEIDK